MSITLESRPSADVSYDSIVGQIKDQSFALVPSPISQPQLDSAFGSFVDFLSLDESVKSRFTDKIILPGLNQEVEIGYYSPDPNTKKDVKQLVHWNRFAISRFKPLRGFHPTADEFMEQMDEVYFETEKAAFQTLGVLEEGAYGITGQFFRNGKIPNLVLRFLAYSNISSQPGEAIGKFHYDQSAFTLGLGETNGGFEIGQRNRPLRRVSYGSAEGLAMLFPGKQIEDLDSESLVRSDFPAAWHGVRQTAEPAYSPDHARLSLVCFVDALETPLASAARTQIR